MVKNLKINIWQNSYKIFIGTNSLNILIELIEKNRISKCLVVIDSNVNKYHSLLVRKIFSSIPCKTYSYNFTSTEKNKNLKSVNDIYTFLTDNYFDRNSVVVAVGGGIVGDVAGFAASTFMRGIKYFQVPTTLLSMVDSSVGGKTGVNYSERKNLVGTFYQPDGVFIDPVFLTTLPKREIVSGAGEVFKYAFLADRKNYNLLKSNLKNLFDDEIVDYEKVILACLRIKANIVAQDEKETTGLRKLLNLGHTFAHAFEVVSDYKVKHGEAVIAGVFCALFLSQNTGYLDRAKQEIFIKDFSFIKLNNSIKKMNSIEVYEKMFGDKKNVGGKIKLVLLKDIGNLIVDVIPEKDKILNSIEIVQKFNN